MNQKEIIEVYSGFVLDRMLGRLARWLRVLGYDAIYIKRINREEIEGLISQGRLFLTRDKRLCSLFHPSFLVNSERVGEQIKELKKEGIISPSKEQWFTRCIKCNTPLQEPDPELAQQNVPDYIFNLNMNNIRHCPVCNKYYWPGTHRTNMINSLTRWGL